MNKKRKLYIRPNIITNIVSIESSIAAGSAAVRSPGSNDPINHDWDDLPNDERELIWDNFI